MPPRRKTVARGTWRISKDMLWLQELLCNIGLRPWVENLRKQGTTIRLRRSSLVKHLGNTPSQYTLQLNFELSERGIPCEGVASADAKTQVPQ